MIKNTETTVTYTLYNIAEGTVVTGDGSNHTCQISKDGGTLTTCTNSPVEVGSGVYKLTLSAAETNCNFLTLVVVSSTADVIVPPVSLTFDDVTLYKASIPSDYAKAAAVATLQSAVSGLPSASEITTSVWTSALRTLSSAVDVSSSSIATIQSGLALSSEILGLTSSISDVNTAVSTISERTSRIPDNPASVGDAMTLTTAYDGVKNFSIDTAAIADAVLRSDISRVEASAPDYSLCTIVLAHLQSAVNNGVWTIFRTDGTTEHLTRTVVASELANPITGVQA